MVIVEKVQVVREGCWAFLGLVVFGAVVYGLMSIPGKSAVDSETAMKDRPRGGVILPDWVPRRVFSDCGGMIHAGADTANIEYKRGTFHDGNERCAWVINSHYGRVRVTVLQHDFVAEHSGLTFVEVRDGQYVHCSKWSPESTNKTVTVELETPAVIYFTTDNIIWANSGFVVEITEISFFARRWPLNAVPLYHTKRPYGSFSPANDSPTDNSRDEGKNGPLRAALLYQPWDANELEQFGLQPSKEDVPKEACAFSVAAYEIFPIHGHPHEDPSSKEACIFRPSNWAAAANTEYTSITVTNEAVLILFWTHSDFGCYLQWHWVMSGTKKLPAAPGIHGI